MVCPVDPYMDDDYFQALKELALQADKGESNLVLMGIEPTYPSEKYGYIIPQNTEHVTTVQTFKEKPQRMWQNNIFPKEHFGMGSVCL